MGHEPTWRKKTRPCPFYSQGRCLFADSCNFVHAASVKSPKAIEVEVEAPVAPTVTVHSPPSSRSPSRRLSGLLFALQDVIQLDEPESPVEPWTLLADEPQGQMQHTEPVSPTDTSHLLSPVDITLRNMSFFADEHREDSLDSGFVEWQGPQPMALSRPVMRSPGSLSTLSLLSSAFGSPSSRINALGRRIPATPYFSPQFQHYRDDDEDVSDLETDDVDEPTIFPFDEGDIAANSTVADATLDLPSIDEDPTIRYSPPMPANTEDSLENIYDIYSVASPVPAASSATSSRMRSSYSSSGHKSLVGTGSSTPTVTPRERVFTPVVAENPSPDSDILALRSSFSLREAGPPILSPKTRGKLALRGNVSSSPPSEGQSPIDRDGGSQTVEVSTQVPFGFRHSFALGRAKNSSLMASRKSKGASSSQSSQSSTASTESSPPTSRLRPLRLSTILYSAPPTSFAPPTPFTPYFTTHEEPKDESPTAHSVASSDHSISNHHLLTRPSIIPEPTHKNTPEFQLPQLTTYDAPRAAPMIHSDTWRQPPPRARSSSRASQRAEDLPPTLVEEEEEDEEDEGVDFADDPFGETIQRPVDHVVPDTAPFKRPNPHVPYLRPASAMSETIHAIATPRPTLMFAIASDSVEEVRRVLESGEAGPNDQVGPQSALEFALTNERLANKVEIIKTLLAYGADPQSIQRSPSRSENSRGLPSTTELEGLDPALRYYVNRADSAQTTKMIQRTNFRPLTRVRFEVVGQDHFIEQLFRVLSMHSRTKSVTPIVVLLCGPSGHGKSLMARKFGSLLEVPTHTVNMTTLRVTNELWQSYSMSPYEEPSKCTLAEFLLENEGQRCVVVLDEIEKTESEKTLFSLLMPWEHGRVSIEAGSRHIDVRNVIWLGTSNLGEDLVFEHHHQRPERKDPMTRGEYMGLVTELRPVVSARLGSSLLSRVTAVLPFVPFSSTEIEAIAMETLYGMGDIIEDMSSEEVESTVRQAIEGYIPAEGARCLLRLLSSAMTD